jgi:hypothetical protein
MGEAKVLSTVSIAPTRCADSATAAMSVSARVGLAGVSMWTSVVVGRIAPVNASVSVWSTRVTVTPRRGSSSVSSMLVPM